MRLQNYLKERYYKGFNFKHPMMWGGEGYIEMFVNPSRKEMDDISKENYDEVRFFAVQKWKKVYAWTPRLIHDEAIKFIKNLSYSDDILGGMAKKSGGTYYMIDWSDRSGSAARYNYLKKDWEWADKYINVSNYLKR